MPRKKCFRIFAHMQMRVEELESGGWRASVHDGRLFQHVESSDGPLQVIETIYEPREPWIISVFHSEESAKEWATSEAVKKVGAPRDDQYTVWRDQSDMSDEEWQRKLTELDFSGPTRMSARYHGRAPSFGRERGRVQTA
jgi:hypothetical protein